MTARYQISRESETDRKSESYGYEIHGEGPVKRVKEGGIRIDR